jgi:hypothetical protein
MTQETMKTAKETDRRRGCPWGTVALLCLAAVLASSCHRRVIQPVVPPPVSSSPGLASYEAGEKAFEAGNFVEAAKAYEAYLRVNTSDNQDRVHFRLGLSNCLPVDSPQNLKLGREQLQQLAKEFPDSQYRPPSDLILFLLTSIDRLSGKEKELAGSNQKLSATVQKLSATVQKLSATAKEQEGTIKQLTDELQRLKAIDMKRSPSRPPR